MEKFEEALAAFTKAVELEPANAQFKQNVQQCQSQMNTPKDPMGDMFGPQGMAKLMANPKTAAFFKDPQFCNMFEMCKNQPQMLMQLM